MEAQQLPGQQVEQQELLVENKEAQVLRAIAANTARRERTQSSKAAEEDLMADRVRRNPLAQLFVLYSRVRLSGGSNGAEQVLMERAWTEAQAGKKAEQQQQRLTRADRDRLHLELQDSAGLLQKLRASFFLTNKPLRAIAPQVASVS